MSARRLDQVKDWPALAAECGFRVRQIAQNRRVSEQTLRRYFHERFQKSPKQCLDEWFEKTALEKLARGDKVSDVAKSFQMWPANFRKLLQRIESERVKQKPGG